jgi:hypothetical protein
VEKDWEEGREGAPSLHGTCDNLHRLAGSLKRWSIESFGAVRKKIRKLEGKLKDLRLYNFDVSEVRIVEKELCELFEHEEVMAREQSRVDWLREGDRNTTFFHAKVTTRKCANRIARLVKEDGSWIDLL